ncbi:DUF1993 family protein, partial [uncultured Bradyrhizobium sp.]|uniref:response regulator transcription factor n=1 Tax=uncultured Bradyrhizobium sp. TaxID=199684 RepID=UPI0026195518
MTGEAYLTRFAIPNFYFHATTAYDILRQNGFRVTGARNGAEMWDTISLAPVDLVLLDVMLPGVDGFEICRQLRQRYGDAMVLIAVSGSDPDDARVTQTFDSVDHYFRKPVDLAALRRLLS